MAWLVWDQFTIRVVNITTPSLDDQVKQKALTFIHADLTQSNLLTFHPAKLSHQLLTAMPQLEAVDVERRWPHSVALTITIKRPALGWSTGGQAYLLDDDGTVIGSLPAGSKLPVVVDSSNLPVQGGQQVVTASFIDFCTTLITALPATGLKATQFTVQQTTYDLTVQTNQPYHLIFDTTRNVNDEVSDLKTIQAKLAQLHQTPNQYIDLRISGRAYYQ